jgi:hypothetical protein
MAEEPNLKTKHPYKALTTYITTLEADAKLKQQITQVIGPVMTTLTPLCGTLSYLDVYTTFYL